MRCDLAVIGAGPAGACAAKVAAQAGLSVVLVERRMRVGTPVQCAEYVPRGITRWVPVTDGAVARVTKDLRTIMCGGEDALAKAPGYILRREVFDEALAQGAVGAGARLFLGAKAYFRGGRLLYMAKGREEVLEASLVLGADGPASCVGKYMGSRVRKRAVAWQERRVLNRELGGPEIHFHLKFSGGYGWIFPREEGVANVGVAIGERSGDLRQAFTFFLASLPARILAEGNPLTVTGGLVPVGGKLPVLTRGKFFLAGDAAGLAHPLSGAGIYGAVVSGTLAGRQAVKVLETGDLKRLGEYSQEVDRELGSSLGWGLAKRREMLAGWSKDPGLFRDLIRRTWPTFPGYYVNGQGARGDE